MNTHKSTTDPASSFQRPMAFCPLLLAVVFTACMIPPLPVWGQLVTQSQASHLGLERAWFAQVNLDQARHHVTNWLLNDDLLIALTSAGSIHALDTNTGETVWIAQTGHPDYPTQGPAANNKYVSVINGTKIMLLDREHGRLKWVQETSDAPTAGPALSDSHAFVTLFSGRIESFPLAYENRSTWFYQAAGLSYHQPTTTRDHVCWATQKGYLYVSRLKPLSPLYRLELDGELVLSTSDKGTYFLVGSTNGNLYSIHERQGTERWRYSTGDSITNAPVLVNDHVFVTSDNARLHTLDAATGKLLWTTPGVMQFAALGKEHAYGLDSFNNLLSIDRKSGGIERRLPLGNDHAWKGTRLALINDQSDRIYITRDSGLVQCLYERGVTQPVVYRQPMASDEESNGETPADPSTETNEASEPSDTSPLDTDEFNNDTQPPMDAPPEDEDPFLDDSNPFG